MNTLYRKVLCSERLPEGSGNFDTDKGRLFFLISIKRWMYDAKIIVNTPEYWLEPIQLPTGEDAVCWIIVNVLRGLSPEKQKEVTKFLLSRKMIDLPTDEEIEKIISELQKHFRFGFDIDSWRSGFKSALELLTGGK